MQVICDMANIMHLFNAKPHYPTRGGGALSILGGAKDLQQTIPRRLVTIIKIHVAESALFIYSHVYLSCITSPVSL